MSEKVDRPRRSVAARVLKFGIRPRCLVLDKPNQVRGRDRVLAIRVTVGDVLS
jgi:hypothetical protein